jgi:hypothetical protein
MVRICRNNAHSAVDDVDEDAQYDKVVPTSSSSHLSRDGLIAAIMTTTMQIWTYIITYTFYPLGIFSSLGRIYCCKYVTRTWRPDDYMGIMVGVTLIGCMAFWQVGLSLGCGG